MATHVASQGHASVPVQRTRLGWLSSSPLTLSTPPQINYASLESKVSDMQIAYAPLLAGVDQFHVPQLTLPPDRY